MGIKMRILLIGLIVLVSVSLKSQETKSTEIIDFEGAKYYKHKVVKGQTMYAVSQLYHVDIAKIKSPLKLKKVLKPGDVLYIPESSEFDKSNHSVGSGTKIQKGQVFHEVKKGDTFYSLTDYYKITKDKLLESNPFLVKGLKIGQVLKIPVSPSFKPRESSERVLEDHQAVPVLNTDLNDSLILELNKFPLNVIGYLQSETAPLEPQVLKDRYKVGIMFPFMTSEGEDFNLSVTSMISLKIYEGILMALDSLKNQGMKFECYTYDTKRDSSKVAEILKKEELLDMDLIFGPLYPNNFDLVHDHCLSNVLLYSF
jgi:LysM repeat protein